MGRRDDEPLEYIKPSGREIVTPEDGCKALIAAVLMSALREAPKKSAYGHEALWFINSDWCRELCEGIDVDYRSYVAGVIAQSDGRLTED